MSESLRKDVSPSPSAALIAPKFPQDGRLPSDAKALSENIAIQRRGEVAFGNKLRKKLQAKGEAYSGMPCCKTLHITIAFDGTNNNDKADRASIPSSCSNIARIFHASIGGVAAEEQGFFRYYSPGVGTVFPDVGEYAPSDSGLMFASGGESRINWGLTRLIDALKQTLEGTRLDLPKTQELVESMATGTITFLSGGLLQNGEKKRAATMGDEISKLEKILDKRVESEEKPHILAIKLYVYGFSRGAAQARTFANWLQVLTRVQGDSGKTEYRFAGLPISIEFLGICDTVAAVGMADSMPFAAGHMGWADDTMRLPDEVLAQCMDTALPNDCHYLKRCVHLVSAHEQRASFPLDSIRRRPKNAQGKRDSKQASGYRDGTEEYLYPGVHSDVGGGYSPGNQGKAMGGSAELLSQIALHHLYAEAFKAGAPLQVPKSILITDIHEAYRGMDDITQNEFDFSSTLVTRFNAWQSQARAGTMDEMMRREHALITAWRIDRYAGGLAQRGFFANVEKDMPKAEQEAWEAIYKRHSAKDAAAAQGKPLPTYTEKEEKEYQANVQLVGQDKVDSISTEKAFDPPLDQAQLLGAAAEFRRDYFKEWGIVDDWKYGSLIVDMLVGGTVYAINEEDEAEEYNYLHDNGTKRYQEIFSAPDKPRKGQEDLVALFDDQVHDSRAWFMNTSGLGPREPFTDYFRIRLVHFDNESNKQLSPIVTAGRVIGLGIAVASIGLSIKKRDPRMLLALPLMTAVSPILTGKVSLPEISAFDPVTGIALPMMNNLDSLRAFTKTPGDVTAKVAALPPLLPLSEATANTPALQKILVAHQALEAVEAARNKDAGSLAGMLAKAANDEDKPGSWKDMLANQVGNMKSSEKKV
ncbi:Rhs element Vgr protein [Pseudomonas chlororaphis]|uniref:DUF2235 domain-containing protein n=1 Tax=Pseudomonas chlororaphis TaxID=587753 RepID=A0AAQ0APK6_9PSED|nr:MULTISPECIES: DUF2235 domain-containing protein [Pseudomonas]AUG43943.1 Rhs element Vgr protein [Pseudomonas chlororaphis]AZE02043.1 hypothetical protein C4K12_6221 [Pseudomonas chlororaphis subsp. aureofaciens]AZE39231.1 hypothetical protein C4K06_6243 [Pseudomonas chlororaphis subsp. aureofaciens]PWY51110.1 DUF2235 domain-containing protein [Pseudomonas sp. RW409]QNR47770.1 DUF2235 domain-containing protein [Pseudomonas chlororaphis]